MMPTNCPRCGKLFLRVSAPICELCVKEEEEIFERVRLYVKENPHVSMNEVSEACEVPLKRIKQYIKDGRLDASEGMARDVTCSKCGRPILSGRMCAQCVTAAGAAVVGMKSELDIRNQGKVHTRDN